MFERETRREKILEARNRELKLKEKSGAGHDDVNYFLISDLNLSFLHKIFVLKRIKIKKMMHQPNRLLKRLIQLRKQRRTSLKLLRRKRLNERRRWYVDRAYLNLF